MNIAKHMEAIVIVAAVALTSLAAYASPAGHGHAGDARYDSIARSSPIVVNNRA